MRAGGHPSGTEVVKIQIARGEAKTTEEKRESHTIFWFLLSFETRFTTWKRNRLVKATLISVDRSDVRRTCRSTGPKLGFRA